MEAEQFMLSRRSLVELNDLSVDLTLCNINKDLRLPSEIDRLPTAAVENVILLYPVSYSSYFDVIIFSICWPKSLTLHYFDKKIGEFLRPQLLKERQWRFIEYTWKEYHMNARIEYKKKNRDDWMTLDRKILATDPRIIEEMNMMPFKQTQRKENNKYSYISRCISRWIAHSSGF
ncbi:uncharacterized protein LOC132060654 [Lycium ferocissimum]|uniref:uncharacterized protein LOC132060654 n=1 Tax=Lycium ferocissimum TaxID=112874 RepID=UPI0028155069|nr:uncharacterized protein LOC132060654 [Lycium ferocissimum]